MHFFNYLKGTLIIPSFEPLPFLSIMTFQGLSSDISHISTIHLNTYGNSHHNDNSLSNLMDNSLEGIDFTNGSLFPSTSQMPINHDTALQQSCQNQFMGQDFQQEPNIQWTTSSGTSFNPTPICSDPVSIHVSKSSPPLIIKIISMELSLETTPTRVSFLLLE